MREVIKVLALVVALTMVIFAVAWGLAGSDDKRAREQVTYAEACERAGGVPYQPEGYTREAWECFGAEGRLR